MTAPTLTPPYPAGSLHPSKSAPLTQVQWNRITDWLGHFYAAENGHTVAVEIGNWRKSYPYDSAKDNDSLTFQYDAAITGRKDGKGPAGSIPTGTGVLPDVINAGKGIAGSITSVADFLKLLVDPNLWLRVGEIVLGLLLVGVGASMLSSKTSSALQRIPVAGKVIP